MLAGGSRDAAGVPLRSGGSPEEARNGIDDPAIANIDQQRDVREARREYRQDWRDYRRRSPDAFRGPAYVGPRGYAYRPIAPGYRFDRSYYDRRYWIDPYRYRLPAAASGRRWIRYGNDVVLLDVRTGRVVNVYNRFFF